MAQVNNEEFPANPAGNRGANHMDLRPQTPKTPVTPPKTELPRVTTGTVVKKNKPLLDRFAETFWGADAESIGVYLLKEVLLPSAKNLIFDMGLTGLQMLLWGEAGKKPILGGPATKAPIKYDGFYRGTQSLTASGAIRAMPNRHDVKLILMESSQDAQRVLDTLMEKISKYQVTSVADYYQVSGVSSEFTDNNFGWANLSEARVRHVPEGWVLDLPRPLPI